MEGYPRFLCNELAVFHHIAHRTLKSSRSWSGLWHGEPHISNSNQSGVSIFHHRAHCNSDPLGDGAASCSLGPFSPAQINRESRHHPPSPATSPNTRLDERPLTCRTSGYPSPPRNNSKYLNRLRLLIGRSLTALARQAEDTVKTARPSLSD
ncbi:hypothetical protein D9611_009720 [Ephemerocybe angulata]|uniref:Uncharacterized protein n=1 Tax=Ephemerocybe angulata TaxID=980116 RepID=A0A8H5C5P3_9AGAR|nr:hypothetical protein D9611_009720 [Tulosesus angulatus]